MRNNIIITVGTSQIREEKIAPLLPSEAVRFSRLRNNQPLNENDIRALILACNTLSGRLLTNPQFYGAEIATLQVMLANPELDFRENGDFILLASDTLKGRIARRILYENLIKKWHISESQILPRREDLDAAYIITGLKENPISKNEVDEAMVSLAEFIRDNLKSHQLGRPAEYQNICVMSGGFKSIIPCLTMLSLIYGFELFYLFEESNLLQSVHPIKEMEDIGEHQFWIEALKRLQANNLIDPAPYLQTALQDRLDQNRQNQVF